MGRLRATCGSFWVVRDYLDSRWFLALKQALSQQVGAQLERGHTSVDKPEDERRGKAAEAEHHAARRKAQDHADADYDQKCRHDKNQTALHR